MCTNSRSSLVPSESLVLGLHRRVVDVLGLASGDSLPLSLLVEQEEQADLNTDETDKGDKDDEDSSDTGDVVRLVFCLEKEWSDNVSGSAGSVEEGH